MPEKIVILYGLCLSDQRTFAQWSKEQIEKSISLKGRGAILERVSPQEMNNTLAEIFGEQFELLSLFTYYKWFTTFPIQANLDLDESQTRLVQANTIYITATMQFNDIFNASSSELPLRKEMLGRLLELMQISNVSLDISKLETIEDCPMCCLENKVSNTIVAWYYTLCWPNVQNAFFQEWAIWSKCFGKVLIVNGPSSSGKTTLSKSLKKLGFTHYSMDEVVSEIDIEDMRSWFPWIDETFTRRDVLHIWSGFKIDTTQYNADQLTRLKNLLPEIYNSPNISSAEIFKRLYYKAIELIFSGFDVVIDLSIEDPTQFISLFNSYPVVSITLYSPIEQVLSNCILRNNTALQTNNPLEYRLPSCVLEQYKKFFPVYSPMDLWAPYPVIDFISTYKTNQIKIALIGWKDKGEGIKKEFVELAPGAEEPSDHIEVVEAYINELCEAVKVEETQMLGVIPQIEDNIIVFAQCLHIPGYLEKLIEVFREQYRDLATMYKGVAFYTRDTVQVILPEDVNIVPQDFVGESVKEVEE